MAFPFGIDLSKFQTSQDGKLKVDFGKMLAAPEPPTFVAGRAGVSWGYEDPQFGFYFAELEKHKLPRLAYHVIYFTQSSLAQMDHLFRILEKAKVNHVHDRIVLDLEVAGGQPRDRITTVALEAMDIIRSRTGRDPVLYSRASWVDAYMTMNTRLANADWWLAQYNSVPVGQLFASERKSPPLLPMGVKRWLIHQTGDKLPGQPYGVVSTYLDYDRWNGSRAEMLTYFGQTESGEETQPPIVVDPVINEPLFQARVITEPGWQLRVRKTPGGVFVRWLQSGQVVDVFSELEGWYQIRPDEWSSSEWMQRLINQVGLIELPLWSQKDPRWATDKLGTSKTTIGGWGCLVTIISAELARRGILTNPGKLNRDLTAIDGYKDGNLLIWSKLTFLFPQIQMDLAFWKELGKDGSDLRPFVDALLASGRPAIVQTDLVPATSWLEEHWVGITGMRDGHYMVVDPIDGTLKQYEAMYGDPQRGIRRVAAFK